MMTDSDTFTHLVRNACFSADSVAVDFTGASLNLTRALVTRALEALLANGLISVTPLEEWPDYYIPDPPYVNPFFPNG